MIPNASYLKIDERGIEMKNLFKTTSIPWQAVSGFKTKFIFVNKLVTFTIDEKLLENSKNERKNRSISGYVRNVCEKSRQSSE
ncbi:PH domain-containing protein [Chryseobacterium indoltheticum]|uniref:PH domain-containing protein n=1 Tax=Chryseobacterium indoltheticum TaxID=254 RepID=UPI003F4957D5